MTEVQERQMLTREQFDQLPNGAVVATTQSTAVTYTKDGDGWLSNGGQRLSPEAFRGSLNSRILYVASRPTLQVGDQVTTREEAEALPVGSMIGLSSRGVQTEASGNWVKQEDDWHLAGTRLGGGTLWGTGWQVNRVGYEEAEATPSADAEPAPVTIQAEALAEGMLVISTENDAVRTYVISREGNEIQALVSNEGGVWQRVQRTIPSAHSTFTLIPQTGENQLIGELAQAMGEAREEREARQAREQWWSDKMREFNSALHEWASHESLDGDFDDLMREYQGIGMKSRDQDYTLVCTITVEHTRTVTASDLDAAIEQAREDAGFRDGGQHTLYSEDVIITDVRWDEES